MTKRMYYDKKIDKALDSAIYSVDKAIDSILWGIYRLLATITVLFESETFNSLQYRYGTWYNLRNFRNCLNYDYELKTKRKVFRIESMEVHGNFIISDIYHDGWTKDNVKTYITNAVDAYAPGTREYVELKITDANHTRVIFPFPE